MLGPDYSCIPTFIVFDCKFDDHEKAQLVVNGSCTPVDPKEAYARVIGMEIVHLGFLLADMSGLKVCAMDISLAYLYAKTHEKCNIIAGLELGALEGEKLVITGVFMAFELLVPTFMNILGTSSIAWNTRPATLTLIFESNDIQTGIMSISPTIWMM